MSQATALHPRFGLDYIWKDSLHMVEHTSNADRPLCFSTLNPFLLLIHQPAEMKIAPRQAGAYLGLFKGCQDTLSCW